MVADLELFKGEGSGDFAAGRQEFVEHHECFKIVITESWCSVATAQKVPSHYIRLKARRTQRVQNVLSSHQLIRIVYAWVLNMAVK